MQFIENYAEIFETFRDADIQLNMYTQKNLNAYESWLALLSTHITVANLMEIVLPLIGVLNYQLMVVLATVLSVTNTLTSIMKWSVPATRPYWFAREEQGLNLSINLRAHNLVCETSAGFPSSHITAWTTFVYISAVYLCNRLTQKYSGFTRFYNYVFSFIVGGCAFGICLSRVYFGTQFLHQCVASTVATILLLHFFDTSYIYQMKRGLSVTMVFALGAIPIAVYFYKLYMDIDPFWSVRTGFKYCPDPLYLKHETSPVFILARDFGFLLGVALSTPIYKRYISVPNKYTRVLVLLVLEIINISARSQIPKQNGRFVFVACEFLRNLAHSYGLLMFLSMLK